MARQLAVAGKLFAGRQLAARYVFAELARDLVAHGLRVVWSQVKE
jgi:hypothetical protein